MLHLLCTLIAPQSPADRTVQTTGRVLQFRVMIKDKYSRQPQKRPSVKRKSLILLSFYRHCLIGIFWAYDLLSHRGWHPKSVSSCPCAISAPCIISGANFRLIRAERLCFAVAAEMAHTTARPLCLALALIAAVVIGVADAKDDVQRPAPGCTGEQRNTRW